MKLTSLLSLTAATLALTACSSLNPEALNGEWEVVSLEGTTLSADKEKPFLGFDVAKQTVYGFTGCNRLTGGLDAEKFLKGKETFDRLGMTRMLCIDSPEEAFLKALHSTKHVRLNESTLVLQNDKKQEVMTLRKR